MGSSKTGLVGTIGVTLLNSDGTTHTARATTGIYEVGGGCYGKQITFPDNWFGSVLWDTGGGSPVYATEDYDIEGLIDMIEEDTSKMHFSGNNIKSRVADKGVLNNPPSEAIADYKDKNTEGEIKTAIHNYGNKDTYKATGFSTHDAAAVKTAMEAAGAKLTAVKDQTDKIEEEAKKMVGLVHENIYIDQPVYDTEKNLTSARVRIYTIASSVGTDNDVLATYLITAIGDGKGKFTSWKQVKQ